MDDQETSCLSADRLSGQEVTLAAVESGNGGDKRLAMVRVDPTSLVAVESRRSTGYDGDMEGEGVIVYVVDVNLGSGEVGPPSTNFVRRKKGFFL